MEKLHTPVTRPIRAAHDMLLTIQREPPTIDLLFEGRLSFSSIVFAVGDEVVDRMRLEVLSQDSLDIFPLISPPGGPFTGELHPSQPFLMVAAERGFETQVCPSPVVPPLLVVVAVPCP